MLSVCAGNDILVMARAITITFAGIHIKEGIQPKCESCSYLNSTFSTKHLIKKYLKTIFEEKGKCMGVLRLIALSHTTSHSGASMASMTITIGRPFYSSMLMPVDDFR